jgi:nitroreductase
MELAEAVGQRRMVRSFTGAPVLPALLDRVLAIALRAPSAGNTQGWDGVVLEGPDQTAKFWEATTTNEWRTRAARWPGLRKAPVVVVLFAHPAAYVERYREPDKAGSTLGDGTAAWPVPYWLFDTGQAALMLLLAAVDTGLGACFLGNFRGEDELRRVLGVPQDRGYVGAVLLGQGADDDRLSASVGRRRRPLEEVFHRGSW